MSDVKGTAAGVALGAAELAAKLSDVAIDFLMGVGCEAFCEVIDVGKDILFEAIKSGKIDLKTKQALENLDRKTVDDLTLFVSKELDKYNKKRKLPKKLRGKDLTGIFMNRLDTVSKLVDNYAAQNNLSEERKIALKYILNEIRQCTAQASLCMLEAEDKRLVLVISQIVRNTFEDYRKDFSSDLSGALFRPTHCCYCASPNLILDDAHGVATCKNCGTKTEYQYQEQTNLLEEAKEAFKAEFEQINAQFEQVYGINLEILRAVNSLTLDTDLKSRLSIAQDHILNYEFPEAVNTCEGILEDYPDSVDAMWCYLQASYGIVYLRGYNDKIAKPTFCYAQDPRSRKRFCKDPYYEKILKMLANDPERMKIYEDRQRDIDAAIEKFKTDLRQGNEYDVFICVKIGLATKNNPDPNPNLVTEDYEKYADVIYEELTRMGLKPYCSKRNAPQGIGSDAQIWSAMLRSKKILIIGTSKEYLTSVWVKCEWRRWLCLIEKLKCREETTFIPWIPVENWVDQQPEEWNPYKPQICQTKEQVIKAIVGESNTTQPIDDSRAIRDIRALLDAGNIDEAKTKLEPALKEHPSNGELFWLNLRMRSDDFQNLKAISSKDVERAVQYLKDDGKRPAKNPEYQMYQKCMKHTPQRRRARAGWTALVILLMIALCVAAGLVMCIRTSTDIGAGFTADLALYRIWGDSVEARDIDITLPEELRELAREQSIYRIESKEIFDREMTLSLALEAKFKGKENNVQVYRIDDVQGPVPVACEFLRSQGAIKFQGKSGTYAVVLVPYVISIYDNDELIHQEELYYGETLTVLPSASPQEGYEVVGFYDAEGSELTKEKIATCSVSYYAKKNPMTYQIALDATEGVLDQTLLSVTYDAVYKLPEPVLTGFTFSGWVDANGEPFASEGVWEHTEDVALTATWIARYDIPYAVHHCIQSLQGNGYVTYETEELLGTTGETVTPAPKEYPGFKVPERQIDTILGDGSLIVYYFYDRITYTITFDVGSEVQTPDTVSVLYGAEYSLPQPECANFVFLGWQTSNGSSFEAEGIWELTEDVTVTALWISCFEYGLQYYEGDGVAQDYKEAVKYFQLAAEQGDARAQYYMGECYYHGYGVAEDLEQATAWYVLAEAQEYEPAQSKVGVCFYEIGSDYYHGFGGKEQNYEQAAKYFQSAANRGNAEAQYRLGYCYDKGLGVDQDYQEAAKWFELSANQGDKHSQWWMGFYYQYGRGVPQDYAEAAKWYELSANQGYGLAQFDLGLLYEYYLDNYVEAAKWYRLYADQGNYVAQGKLGDFYFNGKGVPQDYAEAVKWFRLSADQEYADAQYMLGYCYEHGLGVTKDLEEAAKWYQLAADQGKAISFTYNIVYVSANGTELGSDTVAQNFGTTNTISPKTLEGYNTPKAQSIVWDSVSAKTITFVYEPTVIDAQKLKENAVWWWDSDGFGIKYSVSVEFYNRTADSVTAKITWTNTIKNAWYAEAQYFNMTIGGKSTGRQTIASASKWSGSNSHNGSATKTVEIVITGLAPTTTTLEYSATPGVSGSNAHPGKFSGTVTIPAY